MNNQVITVEAQGKGFEKLNSQIEATRGAVSALNKELRTTVKLLKKVKKYQLVQE